MVNIPQIKTTVTDYFKDKPVKYVYLFGSYARNEATSESDIDLLVQFNEVKKLSFYEVIKFQLELETLLNRKIELVENKLVKSSFRQYIDREKIKLYEA